LDFFIDFLSGLAVSAVRQLLDGLMAASLRAGVEPPPLDLGAFGLLDPAAFSPILQDIAHRLIMPCMEHLSRITWDRLAIEYEGRHREMSSQGLILAQADAGFSDARQRLRALEDQLSGHLAWCARARAQGADQQSLGLLSSRTGALEQQVDDASRLVEQRFGLFRQCSQAYSIARARLHGMPEFEMHHRDRAMALLARLRLDRVGRFAFFSSTVGVVLFSFAPFGLYLPYCDCTTFVWMLNVG